MTNSKYHIGVLFAIIVLIVLFAIVFFASWYLSEYKL